MVGKIYAANIIAAARLGLDYGMLNDAEDILYSGIVSDNTRPTLFIHVAETAARGVYALTGSHDDVLKVIQERYANSR